MACNPTAQASQFAANFATGGIGLLIGLVIGMHVSEFASTVPRVERIYFQLPMFIIALTVGVLAPRTAPILGVPVAIGISLMGVAIAVCQVAICTTSA